jgi:hypothetical protein
MKKSISHVVVFMMLAVGLVACGSGSSSTSNSNPSNPLIGSWYGTNLGFAQSTVVLTFVNDTTFFHAEDGSSVSDPTGQDGMERGTYTWTTNTWTPTVTVDTNGEWGWSSGSGTPVPYSISNNVITFGTGTNTVSLTRIQ